MQLILLCELVSLYQDSKGVAMACELRTDAAFVQFILPSFQSISRQYNTSLSEILNKDNQGKLQSVIDAWCAENDMKLNRSKCKDLIISFAKENYSSPLCSSRIKSW